VTPFSASVLIIDIPVTAILARRQRDSVVLFAGWCGARWTADFPV